jgi:two-component system heavy metal sensor histidine kinase CusS
MRRFRTLRGRLTALALLAALAAVAVLTVAFNVILDRSLDSDANSQLRSLAAAASTTVAFENGRLRVRESPDDAAIDQVWIYQGTRPIERPTGSPELQRTADALAGQAHVFDELPSGGVRLYAAPVTDGGRQVGTVVAAQSLAAYDRTTDLALIGSLALGLVLLAAVGVLTWITVGRALDPVREMTHSAAEWSEHDLAQRFGATPRPDELGELAQTFDALLDRVAASLRHEQRLSAELSHELRTPLARIVAEIELLQRRERSAEDRSEGYALIARSAEQMSGILETLMAAARAEAQLGVGRSEVGEVLARLAGTWQPSLAARDVELEVQSPDAPATAGVDADVVERIVAPLLDNAGRYARSRVVLSARAVNGGVLLTVADDGPGVPAAARGTIFEPGAGERRPNGHGGAGLGLPLARRLAKAIGGDVTLAPGVSARGAEFRVQLPS